MLTEETNITSPYPGLRPFTEGEAIFFKGREEHIAKIQLELSQKRFLMVTGASGDGKSSLIYAGLLPNVRAGFFRGELGRWSVGIFRPGHHPMQNLAQALATALGENVNDVKEKLRFGYSALTDYYKKSKLFIDTATPEFAALNEKEQKKVKRSGNNLLIVVDQFEEFFTNTENFDKETAIPSIEAQLVMNLLLETARLSQKTKLPVYIVCTMRSDYIGNAPAYRGLPEIIGDNQFFVPRLNRDEITKVIEEPAELNGNKISKRLVQRLINDLDVVNTDVLPSLQHALRRLWELANKGTDELDLLHYAMAGGILSTDLPQEDKIKYQNWFLQLPLNEQEVFAETKSTGVSNILNHHAEVLYSIAHLSLPLFQRLFATKQILMPEGQRAQQTNLSKEEAQEFLKSFFQSADLASRLQKKVE